MAFSRLMKPRSIAVFGGAQASEVIRQSDRLAYEGDIWPVHPKKTEILGREVFRSVDELPGSPDAAYVGVNRRLTVEIVRDLARREAGGAVCYATGFSEAGAEGATLENRLLEAAGDMPLVGPNSYGMLNYLDGAALWPDQQGGRRVESGVAIVTMSSNVGFNLTMQRRGLPIAYLLSLGNKLKFDLDDAIRCFAAEPRVTAIGLYLEGIADPVAFECAVLEAREASIPVVALKSGRSSVAQQMVLSHTASLAGTDDLMDALFDRSGVARVDSLESLVEALKVLHVLGPLPGRKVGAMSTSGGDLTLLADAMAGTGLSLPPLSTEVAENTRRTVHDRIVASNPLDYQMFDWNDEDRLTETFAAFLGGDFDITLSLLDFPREDRCDQSDWNEAEHGFRRAVRRTGARAGVLSTLSDTISEPVAARLIAERIVPLAGVNDGLAGIRAAAEIGAGWSRRSESPLLVDATAGHSMPSTPLDESESKAMLARLGVPVPRSLVVREPGEAAAAASILGFPVVVKALGIAHKTDVGAVRLGLESQGAVERAVDEMKGLSTRFLVEEMIDGAVAELIVGVNRDRQFGPYLLVGRGGVLVELVKDSVSLLLPVSRQSVLRAFDRLRCAPLFHGFRGGPHADLEAAADAVLNIAAFVESDPAAIAEIDVNPLMLRARGGGVVAADALICMRENHE